MDEEEGDFDAMVAEDQEFHGALSPTADADVVTGGQPSHIAPEGHVLGNVLGDELVVVEAEPVRPISRLQAVRLRVAARLAQT